MNPQQMEILRFKLSWHEKHTPYSDVWEGLLLEYGAHVLDLWLKPWRNEFIISSWTIYSSNSWSPSFSNIVMNLQREHAQLSTTSLSKTALQTNERFSKHAVTWSLPTESPSLVILWWVFKENMYNYPLLS